MATTITLTPGGPEWTIRPRTLRLERSLSEPDGIRDRTRALQAERTRMQVELAIVTQRVAEQAATETLDEALIDDLLHQSDTLERRMVDNSDALVVLELQTAAILLTGPNGESPTMEDLESADLEVIGEVIDTLAGIRPTNRTRAEA